MKLGMRVDLGPGHIVLDGNTPPLLQMGTAPPQLLTHVYCGQIAGWIKMALGMEVGLGPGHIALGGDPAALPQKGAEPPFFPPISIVAKRLDGLRCHLVWRQASAQGTLC